MEDPPKTNCVQAKGYEYDLVGSHLTTNQLPTDVTKKEFDPQTYREIGVVINILGRGMDKGRVSNGKFTSRSFLASNYCYTIYLFYLFIYIGLQLLRLSDLCRKLLNILKAFKCIFYLLA